MISNTHERAITNKTLLDPFANERLRQADIDAGKLVLRKRGGAGALQRHEESTSFEEHERVEDVKREALKQAARRGWVDVSAGRYADVADDQLKEFVGQMGCRATHTAKTKT
ncbi:hypothetical protein [Rhizobacter sp. SG703]|uniref:hypothetical protein n=1 Tax=Rhizobacter sp. SG703 TaxID=2587140 RepID=UPI001838CC62|nr:hypothetical protein [Rhizobacter sp. SG703]NKI95419.1 antitoxin ParD1/3/4 [Rhizobacter sp. SG703]